MVSGVTDAPTKYKSNKKGYYPSVAPHHRISSGSSNGGGSGVMHHHQSSLHNTKRFSDGDLRPWPPMYTSGGRSSSGTPSSSDSSHFRSLSGGSGGQNGKSNPNYKNIMPNNKTNFSANSVYERNKFNFHHNGKAINGGVPISHHLPSSNNRHSTTSSCCSSSKNANKDYYMLTRQSYMMNGSALGSVYNGASRDSNLLMIAKEREKNRFRKLR